ncbi:MAG TPA: succinylglutamate-semialdehyde dehydrogenase [Tepidisphaeraceae bacterium]|jgi:succinylglutamic semialdehyde dehydrogenase|nr:succinylglutamate-semialdehyde dehydrogenase [Tepidisphaeraceae bacterium]
MSQAPGLFSSAGWEDGAGAPLQSTDPATGAAVWQGRSASGEQVDRAVRSAAAAAPAWAATPFADRLAIARQYAERLRQMQAEFVDQISRETGKPRWEAKTELDAMIGKIAISADAYADRCKETEFEQGGVKSAMRFRPHGVVAVLGPFNFPGHLPNGHIVPALLAGNTVVFKPSELAPGVGELMARAWQSAELPPGALNLVQGGLATGEALAGHPRLDGLYFTGSAATGLALSRQFADTPGKILALEMGGNNPLIAWDITDLPAAAICIIQSAYITAGQRCSCARRLIIPADNRGETIVTALVAAMQTLRVGLAADDPEPFIGPLISPLAADKMLAAEKSLLDRGAVSIVPLKRDPRSPALLSPGLIDVTPVANRPDAEFFGPMLQLIGVADFPAALKEANNTRFGLCAGLLSDDRSQYDQFSATIRAGVIYWNRPTTGASSRLPFGGLGNSGNHRPSAYLAADYCSRAIAETIAERLTMPTNIPPGVGK